MNQRAFMAGMVGHGGRRYLLPGEIGVEDWVGCRVGRVEQTLLKCDHECRELRCVAVGGQVFLTLCHGAGRDRALT